MRTPPIGKNNEEDPHEDSFSEESFGIERDVPILIVDQHVARTGVVAAEQLVHFITALSRCTSSTENLNGHYLRSVEEMEDFRDLGRDLDFSRDAEVAMNFIIKKGAHHERWVNAGFAEFPYARVLDVIAKVQPFIPGKVGLPASAYLADSLCSSVSDSWHMLEEKTQQLLLNGPESMSIHLRADGTAESAWLGGWPSILYV